MWFEVEARLNGQRHKPRMDTVKPRQVRDCKMERKIQDAWPTTERQLGRMLDKANMRF